jgi:DNA-binding NarL/FixJ family response regulator
MPITVSIVEYHPPVRAGLGQLISRAADFHCLSQHDSAEDALKRLPTGVPDLVLLDMNLPGLTAVEAVHRLKILPPRTKIVLLAMFKQGDAIFQALMAGAHGYVLKHTPPGEFLNVLREVHAGGAHMTSQVARKMIQELGHAAAHVGGTAELTAGEQTVLELVSQGLLNWEIAEKLRLSPAEVSTHLVHVYDKLHQHTRSQVAAAQGTAAWPPRAGQPRFPSRPPVSTNPGQRG